MSADGMPAPLRVLILEDNPADLELVLRQLRVAGFDFRFESAEDEAGYTARLDSQPDVILADYNLPRFDALRALRILQDRGLPIPFIVVTGSISEEAAVACMKNGATDYLLKDRLARLGPAIRQALEGRKDREEKRQAEEQIRQRNRELTLLNRVISASARSAEERAFLQAACDELARALGAHRVFVALFDAEGGAAKVAASSPAEPGGGLRGASFPTRGDPLGGLLHGLRAPLAANDLAAEAGLAALRESPAARGASSLAAVPLSVDGNPAGVLVLEAREAGAFGRERMDLLQGVAAELSNALSRSRIERERWLLSAAAEQSSDAALVTDREGRILYANAGFERMSGYGRPESIGRSAAFLDSGRKEPGFLEAIRQAGLSRAAWHGRMTQRRKDGSPYTVDLSLTPVFDADGTTANLVAIQRDITVELQREERDRQAQKMEAVGRLAGGVAHDFNNLLTTILGYADLLSQRIGPEGSDREDLDQIRRAAQKASALTRQLLAFSRRQVLQRQPVNLNERVAEMEKMLRPLLGENIELQLDLETSLGPVLADPGQIDQVIMNLAVNARDAMPRGGRIVLATANAQLDDGFAREHPGSKSGPFIALTVTDTGTGIDEEVMSHLFEPFFTTKAEGKGTGLGLATVYGIVKQSGGYIRPSSRPGKGTTFAVFLPRLEGKPDAEGGGGEETEIPKGRESVLLVEDEEMVRTLMHRALTQQGFSVTVARRPEEALALAAEARNPIDILVSDVVMPGIGGWELSKRVRSIRPGVKVLLVSGYMEGDALDGVREDGTAFLQKPFSPTALVRAVRALVDQ